MESQSLHKAHLISHIVAQMIEACELISLWNDRVETSEDYLTSPEGMQKMAASCMLIESIGEGVKKVDRLSQGLLYDKFPNTPWKGIIGLRDHIAHGYFNLDADIILDVVKTEIPTLQKTLEVLLSLLK